MLSTNRKRKNKEEEQPPMPRKPFLRSLPPPYIPPPTTGPLFTCRGCGLGFRDEHYLNQHRPDACFEVQQRGRPLPPTADDLQQTSTSPTVGELKKEIERLKKQLIVQNTKYTPNVTFDEWKKSGIFVVEWRHLQKVYKESLIDSVEKLLKEIAAAATEPLPIATFPAQPKNIYVFQDGDWKRATTADLERFVEVILQKYSNAYVMWYQQSFDAVCYNEDLLNISISLTKRVYPDDEKTKKALRNIVQEWVERTSKERAP